MDAWNINVTDQDAWDKRLNELRRAWTLKEKIIAGEDIILEEWKEVHKRFTIRT